MKSFALEVLELMFRYSHRILPETRFCLGSEGSFKKKVNFEVPGVGEVSLTAVDSDTATRCVEVVLAGNAVGFPDAVLALHGPPGTGKTTTLFRALESSRLLETLVEGKEDILLVYVSPTNYLVREAAAKLIRSYIKSVCRSSGCEIEEVAEAIVKVLRAIRMYGSKVQPLQGIDDIAAFNRKLKELEKIVGAKVVNELKDAIERLNSSADKNVRIIFTTEWQDFVTKVRYTQVQNLIINMFIDEASRSAYYKPFITARSYLQYLIDLIEGRETRHHMPRLDIYGFVVAGDAMQALTDPEEKGDLLLTQLEKKLSMEGHEDRALLLKYTKRLPKGTERPISHGFYKDVLESIKHCDCVREIITRLVDKGREIERNCNELAKTLGMSEKVCKYIIKVLDGIYDRLGYSNDTCPVAVLQTPSFPEGVNIDERRAKIAALTTTVIASALETPVDILVETPYTELRDYTRWLLQRLGKKISVSTKLRVETVHAVLGGEADIVVSVLGKEWPASRDDISTLYFTQPEVLNVQLSRHRMLLLVIGDIEKLARAARSRLIEDRKSASALLFKTAYTLMKREYSVMERVLGA